MRITRQRRLMALATASLLTLSLGACSAKGSSSAAAEVDGVKTGAGISGDTITLGILSDLTGPFAALSTDLNRGAEMYWDELNKAGGVCDRFQVKLDIKDHGYNVQNAVSLYGQTSQNVLAYQTIVGGSHTAAILDQAEREHKLIIPSSSTPTLAQSDVVMVPAPTYDVDMETVAGFLLEKGLIKKGDKIATIYMEGDYGETAHKGVQKSAEENGFDLLEYKIKASDSDLTAQVNDAVDKGAQAILVSGVPGHTASVASVLQSRNADLPIGGSWPSYTSSMFDTPAGAYLYKHFYAGSPATTWDTPEGQALYKRATAAYPDAKLTNQFAMGYGMAKLFDTALEAACKAGDLTPEGVVKAKMALPPVETDGIMPTMDYTKPGQSPTRSIFMFQPDPDVPGKLKSVADGLYTSKDAS